MEEKYLEFPEEWLDLEKYHFKIITVAAILADDLKAFRGSLNAFCEYIGIGASSANKTKIKDSLKFLEENDFVKVITDKDIYTISLAKSFQSSKKITTIKKAWYKLIREQCKSEPCSWESALKVFLVLMELSQSNTFTYEEIGKKVGLKKSAVKNCVSAIKKIDFKDFFFDITLEREKVSEGEFRTKGQIYQQAINFE